MSQSEYSFESLLNIMAALRGPEGCPWDRDQDHASLAKYLEEEAYEFLEAVAKGDAKAMCEELGDVMLQVVFHAQVAKEKGKFSIEDVLKTLCEKLIRRHPHVFGDEKAASPEEVSVKWNEIKSREKKAAGNFPQAGCFRGLPPLRKADKIQKKAAAIGFDWHDAQGPLEKTREEIRELAAALEDESGDGPAGRVEEEFGDILFALINLSRHLKIDPAMALEKTNQKFLQRLSQAEKMVKSDGKIWEKLTLEEMDVYWEKAKKAEINQKGSA